MLCLAKSLSQGDVADAKKNRRGQVRIYKSTAGNQRLQYTLFIYQELRRNYPLHFPIFHKPMELRVDR